MTLRQGTKVAEMAGDRGRAQHGRRIRLAGGAQGGLARGGYGAGRRELAPAGVVRAAVVLVSLVACLALAGGAGAAGCRTVGPLALAAGIGQGANAILPGKLGEAVGAHALGRLADLSRIQSLGIMVVTRLTDAVILFALVLGATWFLPSPALRALRGASLIAVATATLALLLPVVLRRQWGVRCLNYAADVCSAWNQGASNAQIRRGLTTAGRAPLLLVFLASTALMGCSFAVVAHSCGLLSAPRRLRAASWADRGQHHPAGAEIGTVHYFGLVALSVSVPVWRRVIIAYHALDLMCAPGNRRVAGPSQAGLSLCKPELDVLARASAPVDGLTFGAAALELTTPEQSQPQQHHSTTTLLAAEEA